MDKKRDSYDVIIPAKNCGKVIPGMSLASTDFFNVLSYFVTKLLDRLQHKAYHVKEQVRMNFAKVMDC